MLTDFEEGEKRIVAKQQYRRAERRKAFDEKLETKTARRKS
jgi:hypothetical protein